MGLHLCDAGLGSGDHALFVPDVSNALPRHCRLRPLGKVGQFLKAFLDGDGKNLAV